MALTHSHQLIWWSVFWVLIMIGCDQENEHADRSSTGVELHAAKSSVIYGDDSRLEYYELAEGDLIKRRAFRSAALLLRPNQVSIQGDRVLLNTTTLREERNLCADERFAQQPSPGHCSGTLIDGDLLLTAGHCVDDATDCRNTRVVFHSLYTALGSLYPTTTQDLYSCEEIIARSNDNTGDYAIIRLDRAVTGSLEPAPFWNVNAAVPLGTNLSLIGGPNGIPLKIDQEGTVLSSGSASRINFELSVDAFGGNSGSGLFNQQGEVVGILVSGRSDYIFDTSSNCFRVDVVGVDSSGIPEDERGGETGTYAYRALTALCAALPTALPCLDEQSGGSNGGDPMSGGTTGTGEMTGGDVPPLECADAQEEDDNARLAVSATFSTFTLYNFCDDAEDWVRFEALGGEKFDFETYAAPFEGISVGSEVDTVLSIFNAQSTLLSEDDDGGSGRASRILGWEAPTTGTYHMRIRSYGSATSEDFVYRLMTRKACSEDEFEDLSVSLVSTDSRARLQDDRPTPERLMTSTPRYPLPLLQERSLCDEDWIPILITDQELVNSPTLIAQTQISLEITTRVDTLLELYDPVGNRVAQNDDRSRTDRSSYFTYQLSPQSPSGTYWLRVSAYNDVYEADGPYTLSVAFAELCDDEDNDQDGVIDEGLVDCLTCEPDLYEDNDHLYEAVGFGLGYITELNHCLDTEDWMSFTLVANQSIDIETYIERNTDTIARLHSATGEVLAGNDDRAQGQLASLIEDFTATATGEYFLQVTEYGNRFGPEYPYSLLVRFACTADEMEHDDLPTEARLLSLEGGGVNEQATLCDPDWRLIELVRGQWVDLTLMSQDQSRSIELQISTDFGRRVISTRLTGVNGTLTQAWEAPETGQYWISTQSGNRYYGGDFPYSLSLETRALDLCDGEDNDQDGLIDEEVRNRCNRCGPLPVERCDGTDNDCDGLVDEETLNACGTCGETPSERCDGTDNDCDGMTDEGVLNACGQCGSAPSEQCDDVDNDCDGLTDEGVLNACGQCGEVPLERCDAVDNDCDGMTDEGLLNACGECGAAPPELCDRVDNDCDGIFDEGCPSTGGSGAGMEGGMEISAGRVAGVEAGEEAAGSEEGGAEVMGGGLRGGETAGIDRGGDDGNAASDDVVVVVNAGEDRVETIAGEPEEAGSRPASSGCASMNKSNPLQSLIWLLFLGYGARSLRRRLSA